MKKLLLLSFCILFTLFAFSNPSDSTGVNENGLTPFHLGTVPVYTPFITMYKVPLDFDNDGTPEETLGKMGFVMLVEEGDEIEYEEYNPNGACASQNCKMSWKIHTYERGTTGGHIPVKLWLARHNSALRRTPVTIDGVKYDLCTFTINYDHDNPNAKKRVRFVIGEHKKGRHFPEQIHEGGAVHLPD